MSVEFASRDLSAKYDRFARWYDSVEAVLEFLGVRKLRQAMVAEASGKVLEVAVGTGKNLYYYRREYQIIAVDLSTCTFPHPANAPVKRRVWKLLNPNGISSGSSIGFNPEPTRCDNIDLRFADYVSYLKTIQEKSSNQIEQTCSFSTLFCWHSFCLYYN